MRIAIDRASEKVSESSAGASGGGASMSQVGPQPEVPHAAPPDDLVALQRIIRSSSADRRLDGVGPTIQRQLEGPTDDVKKRFGDNTLTVADLADKWVKDQLDAMNSEGLKKYGDACNDVDVKKHILRGARFVDDKLTADDVGDAFDPWLQSKCDAMSPKKLEEKRDKYDKAKNSEVWNYLDGEVNTFKPAKLKASFADYRDNAATKIYGNSQTERLGSQRYTKKADGTKTYESMGAKLSDNKKYYEEVDKVRGSVTENQKDLLDIARKAARDEAYFEQVTAGVKNQVNITYTVEALENNEFTFSPELQGRIKRYVKFMVAVGLYTTRNLEIPADKSLRSRKTAHRWSTQHCILFGKTEIQNEIMSNIVKMYYEQGGENVRDEDGTIWARKSDFVDNNGKPISETIEALRFVWYPPPPPPPRNWSVLLPFDREKTWKNIQDFTKEKKKSNGFRDNPSPFASEGYDPSDPNRLPNAESVTISNHLSGNALDLGTVGFPGGENDKNGVPSFAKDPIHDYIAWEFGLQRNAKGEAWHFECTGLPVP